MRIRATAAALMVAAALAANTAFIALGAVFDYPDVLAHPAAQVLAEVHERPGQIAGLFLLLAVSAGLFVPIAVLVGQVTRDTAAGRLAVTIGVLAGLVQVLGLTRWVFAVPDLARIAVEHPDAAGREAAVVTFSALGDYLGTGIGETLGYLTTATWTVLVLAALPRAPRWFTVLGLVSALAVLDGVLVPLGVEGAGPTNFIGYIAWSIWLLCFAWLLVSDGARSRSASDRTGPTADVERRTAAVPG